MEKSLPSVAVSSSKVETYERFVNEKLRPDLKAVMDQQEKIYTDIAEYLKIKDTIEKLTISGICVGNKAVKPLETKVDLGCNFYANAVVDDPSRIFIAIGYDFYVEMTFDEALKYIEKTTKRLYKNADELNVKASEIKAHIRFVLEGLREIQNIEFAPEEPKNSLFI